ncbi:MAG: tRNA (adenosine(37)-N6)-threonylcarbamoyltransferase complex ATPase subunit type 1 TsaE [Cyanobacteria bacterium]|nr:tRNA (adenosine(37)-N6)-threonylcarbamoyltransferase complex ATPase subunit type 1 TsaE [Cyanobacteriota bacterium]
MFSFEVELKSREATDRLGKCIAEALEKTAIIALAGNLGAGKTTLSKAIACGLGVSEVVNSPTFTTMNEYHSGRIPIYHYDFYRVGESLHKPDFKGEEKAIISLDAIAAEFEEILESNCLVLIEWPEFFLVGKCNFLEELDHIVISLMFPCDLNEAGTDGEEMRLATLASTGPISSGMLKNIASRLTDCNVRCKQ